MKPLGVVVTTLLILAAAQAVTSAMIALLLVGVVYGMLAYPRHMLGLLIFCLIGGLIQTQPLASLGVIALIVTAAMLGSRNESG